MTLKTTEIILSTDNNYSKLTNIFVLFAYVQGF